MRTLKLLLILLMLVSKNSYSAAASGVMEGRRPGVLKQVDNTIKADPKNIHRLCDARKMGINIPIEGDTSDYLEEDVWRMPSPLPYISSPFDILDLAREGESVAPYLKAYQDKLNELAGKTNAEGDTILTHIIRQDSLDIEAVLFLSQNYFLLFQADSKGIQPIFHAIEKEKSGKWGFTYSTILLGTYAVSSHKSGLTCEDLMERIENTKNPITGKSMHEEFMSYPDESVTKQTYLEARGIGRS